MVAIARLVADAPVPIHFAHADMKEMFSGSRRFGAVVSVTVRNQSASRSRLPFQPYDTAGMRRPVTLTRTYARSAGSRTVVLNQGRRSTAYGLMNVATPTSAPDAPEAPRVVIR